MAFRSPAGKNSPMKGVIISSTRAVTSLEAAWPMTNAIANPIIPNVLSQKTLELTIVLLQQANQSYMMHARFL
jgi:hypothetical protein